MNYPTQNHIIRLTFRISRLKLILVGHVTGADSFRRTQRSKLEVKESRTEITHLIANLQTLRPFFPAFTCFFFFNLPRIFTFPSQSIAFPGGARTGSVSYTQPGAINFHGREGELEPSNERSRALSEINNAGRPLCRQLSNFPMESKCQEQPLPGTAKCLRSGRRAKVHPFQKTRNLPSLTDALLSPLSMGPSGN